MKFRSLVLSVLCCLASVNVSAQIFQASVLGGANLSQIDGDMLFGFHKVGANAGVRVVAVINDRWRVGPEILFSQQGARQSRDSFNISPFSRVSFNTLEVPLMVYYKDWRLTGEAGFSFQRVFNGEVINGRNVDISADVPFRDNLFAFKMGVTFYVTENLGFNFRWSKHVADIADFPDRLSDVVSFKGRSLSLRAVYTIGRGESLPANTSEPE